jgi:phospholipase C
VKLRLTLPYLALAALTCVCSGCGGSGSGMQVSRPPGTPPPPAGTGLNRVNHIIVVVMENHSFDNYLGALAYAPQTPYHTAPSGCASGDHSCVDGLTCSADSAGGLACSNSNPDSNGVAVVAFHDPSRCVVPDLDHSWPGSHMEANFSAPNTALADPLNDGFVRVNDVTEPESNRATMGFYTQEDLPFYYDLAQKFAIDDRYFASVLGPTLPNRFYLMTATSFGHVDTGDSAPPGAFKPITGTILDLLDGAGVSWTNFYQNGPQAASFRAPTGSATDPHFQPMQSFLTNAAGGGTLPQVSFLDPSSFGPDENDEHPPTDIQRGQAFVAQIVNAVRKGPYWQDSVIFITWDEHGGFYDHVAPPTAAQESARTPDTIFPGQCADLSNPPASQQPGGGIGCSSSVPKAQALCPLLASSPNGPYPVSCASFDQLGFRVPFLVVSPFAKPHYVSHTPGDHASILAFIEARFLARAHLTLRDRNADTLEDLFDFDHAPSSSTPVTQARLPTVDCTPGQ